MLLHQTFYVGAGDPKSSLHAWLVGTVPTEMSLFPELPLRAFSNMF